MKFLYEIGYTLVSVLKGLRVTGRNLFRRKTTLQYPEQRPDLAPRYRGFPIVNLHTCIGCLACEKVCPNQLIHIERSPGEVKGRWKVDRFDLDYSLCMMCNLCEDVCPTDAEPKKRAIALLGGYELAGTDRSQLSVTIESGKMVIAPTAYYRQQESLGLPTEPEPPAPAPEKPAKTKPAAREVESTGEGESPAARPSAKPVDLPSAKTEPPPDATAPPSPSPLSDDEKAARIAAARERARQALAAKKAKESGASGDPASAADPAQQPSTTNDGDRAATTDNGNSITAANAVKSADGSEPRKSGIATMTDEEKAARIAAARERARRQMEKKTAATTTDEDVEEELRQ